MLDLNQISVINEKEFSLQLITPLVMHGAEPKASAELRPDSLKGLLRYWWRAIHPDATLETEMKVFGGTSGENARKSPVTIQVLAHPKNQKAAKLLPHKGQSPQAPAFEEGQRAKISLRVYKGKDELSNYENLFAFMMMISGMGQRARRGFGSCQLEEQKWESTDAYLQALTNVLQKENVQVNRIENGVAVFPNTTSRHPIVRNIWVGKGYAKHTQALVGLNRAAGLANANEEIGRIGGKGMGRHASPFWLSIRKIGNQYIPIIVEVSSGLEETVGYKNAKKELLKKLEVEK